MSKAGAHIEGMEFLKDQLEDFMPRESKAIMRRTTSGIASRLRKKMRELVPVARGVLRKAIVSKRMRGTRDSVEAGIYITKGKAAKHDGFHWHFQEFGTQHHPPQPFVGPVYEEARADYRSLFGAEFGKQLQKQMEKRAKAQQGARK